MRHSIEFEFDVPFIRAGLRRDFAWRAALLAGLMAGLLLASRLWLGVFHPFLLAAVGAGTAVVLLRLHLAFRSAAQCTYELWSRQSPSRRIRFELDDEGFRVVLDQSNVRYEWRGLRRLWRYPDVWIVEIVKHLSVFFPPGAASEEARAYVVERCRAAGVRV